MSYTYTPSDADIEGLLEAMAPDENGVLPDNILELEELLGEKLTQQYDGYTDVCRVYADLGTQIAAIDAEVRRLKAKKEAAEARQERLMEFMSKRLGTATQQFGAFTYSSRKTPETLKFSRKSEEQVTEMLRELHAYEYLKHVPETYHLDRNAMKDGIRSGDLEFLTRECGVTLEAGRKYKIT